MSYFASLQTAGVLCYRRSNSFTALRFCINRPISYRCIGRSNTAARPIRLLATMATIHKPIPLLKLNDGNSIPLLSYGTGTAWFKSADTKLDKDCVEATKTAINLGYYHLDCAESYNTETEVGIAIKESGVDRSKLFVTTKVSKNVGDIPNAIKASLKKLGLDYVDLYLIHEPYFANSDEDFQKAWADMEAVQAQGLAKSIGVSNYQPKHFEAFLKTAKVIPAINQIEFHPYLQHLQPTSLLEYQKKHGIAASAYGPLTPVTKAKPGPLDDYQAALAKKYAVSENEVLLRWCIDQDVVAITTSSKEQRLTDYLRCTTFNLTPTEIKEVSDLGEKKHYRAFWTKKFAPDDRT